MNKIADQLPAGLSPIITNSPSSVALLDNRLCYLTASNKWLSHFKLGLDYVGKCHTDIFHIVGKDWLTTYHNALKGKPSITERANLIFPNGIIHLVRWELQPWIKNDGNIGGVVVYMDLIIEESEKDANTKRMLSLYEETNEVASIGGWEIDLVKNQIHWSPTAKKIHGVSPSYVPNLTRAIDFFKEGKNRDQVLSSFLLAVETGQSYDIELELVTADGKDLWVRVKGNAEMIDGVCKRVYGTFQDIQTKKLQELQLANSELKYRSIIENSLYAFLQVVSGELIVDANQAAIDMFGYTAEEFKIPGKKLLTDARDPDLKYFKELIEKVGTASAELTGIRKNGELFPCHASAVIYMDSEGRRNNSLMVIDITERIKSEEKIRMSEEQFRGAFEYSAIGMALINIDGTCRRANQSLCDMLGYTEYELIGSLFSNFSHPEDRLLNVPLLKEMIDGKRDNYYLEKRYLHKNGEVLWVSVGMSVLRSSENLPLQFIAQIQDVTKFKAAELAIKVSEEKYRKIFENTQDIYYRTDQAGDIVEISPSIARVYGESPENIIGTSAAEFYYFDEDKVHLMNALKQDGSVMDFEVKFRNNKAELLYASVNARLIVEDGLILGSEGYIRDITLRKLQENELTSLNTELKALNTHREKLLSVVGHDLRNPVSASLQLTELAIMDVYTASSEDLAAYLLRIKSGLQNANALLEDLLSWAKSQFDAMNFNPVMIEDVQLQVVVCLKRLKPMADVKNIELTETVAGGLRVLADKDMLDTIIRNLVSNAIKFTSGGSVNVSASRREADIIFTVADTGVGIPKEALANLFNKKSHYTTFGTSGEKGTGLGLELCRDFVEKHGGNIWVESESGLGSSFHFTIPLRYTTH